MHYPASRPGDVVDLYGATRVADPYRWKEDLESPEVAAWVGAQNAVTRAHLDTLPQRASLVARLTALWNYSRSSVPVFENGALFCSRNSGLRRQALLLHAARLRFDPKGPALQGPLSMIARAIARSATMAAGLSLPVWATDDAKYSSGSNAPQRNPPPAVILHWSKYRGPGTVTFDKTPPVFEKTEGAAVFNGKATVVAKFSQPDEYVLHLDAEDYSGRGGGEICCFTTAMVKVTVTQ